MLDLNKTVNMNSTLGRMICYLGVEVAELIDVKTPRSDNKCEVSGITLGEYYPVMGYRDKGNIKQIIIINDKGKLCRYSAFRFNINEVDASI